MPHCPTFMFICHDARYRPEWAGGVIRSVINNVDRLYLSFVVLPAHVKAHSHRRHWTELNRQFVHVLKHSAVLINSVAAMRMGLKASRRRYMYHVGLHDRLKCSPVNVVSSDIRVMQIFAWGSGDMCVKQFVSSYYISMISLHNAVARLT